MDFLSPTQQCRCHEFRRRVESAGIGFWPSTSAYRNVLASMSQKRDHWTFFKKTALRGTWFECACVRRAGRANPGVGRTECRSLGLVGCSLPHSFGDVNNRPRRLAPVFAHSDPVVLVLRETQILRFCRWCCQAWSASAWRTNARHHLAQDW